VLLQLLTNGFVNGCVYAILSLSFALIYNTTRILHIAHGGAYTAGAYACYSFLMVAGLPLWASGVLAVLVSAIVGAAIELVVYAPLVRRGSSPLVSFLTSLGLYVAMVNTIALIFGSETKVLHAGAAGVERVFHLGPVILNHIQISQVVVAAVLLPCFMLFLRSTIWGKVIVAVRDNQVLASVLGFDVALVRLGVFALGTALAGLAAVITSLDLGMDPQIGLPALLTGAVALIVGGVGTFEGPIVGGFLLGFLQSVMVWKLSTRWTDALTFGVLIAVLLLRPSGVLGRSVRIEEAGRA
jgi:branched-chain amino acid transport system permease protein